VTRVLRYQVSPVASGRRKPRRPRRHLPLNAVVHSGPQPDTLGPKVNVEFERVEALELLAMTLAHLNHVEAHGEISTRVPLLTIRDKLALALREET
jgi:hypothetical protein